MKPSLSGSGFNSPLILAGVAIVTLAILGSLLLADNSESADRDPQPSWVDDAEKPVVPPQFGNEASREEAEVTSIVVKPNEDVLEEPVFEADFGPQGTLSGKVIAPDRSPVAEARITLFKGSTLLAGNFPGSRSRLDIEAITDQDGTFHLEEISVGNGYVVVAHHDEWARTEITGLQVRKDKTTSGIVLRMGTGAVVTGLVTEVSGTPIMNARVELFDQLAGVFRQPQEQRPWKVVFTDPSGAFSFARVSAMSYRVRVEASGFETVSRTVSNALAGAPKDEEMLFTLNQGQDLPGRVVDPKGYAIPDARLQATSVTPDYQSSTTAISNEDGQFLLEGLGPHDYQLRVTCHGYSDVARKLHITAGQIQVTLHPRGSVAGWVSAASGEPIPNFELLLMRHHFEREPTYTNDRRDFSDPEGAFTFDNIEPGEYILEARAEEWADSRSARFTVDRDSADIPLQVMVSMSKGGTIAGRVVTATGEPAYGATVAINPNEHMESVISELFGQLADTGERKRVTHTDEEGLYQLTHVPPGTYQVTAKHTSSAPRVTNDVSVFDDTLGGNVDFDISLPPGAIIAGRAYDDKSQIMAFTKIQISQKGTGFLLHAKTDADGTFRFENLSEGNYQVTLNPETVNGEAVHPFMRLVYAQKSQKDVYVTEGQQYTSLHMSLQQN